MTDWASGASKVARVEGGFREGRGWEEGKSVLSMELLITLSDTGLRNVLSVANNPKCTPDRWSHRLTCSFFSLAP